MLGIAERYGYFGKITQGTFPMNGEPDTFKVSVSNYALAAKIPQGSDIWPKFNSSFENKEIPTDALMQMVYDGRPITTWHKDHWRTSANYICGQSIGLDFDSGDEKSTIQQLSKDKFISKYAAFVHTTISHKAEAPRARVLFVLDTPICQAKNYVLAASALLWVFGTADRACAKGCEFEYINQVLPLEVIKMLIASYSDSGQREKAKADHSNYHAPATQQEVAEALKYIPPWQIEYQEWVQVLMGIHAEFGDGGYQLAECWGDGKGDEISKKWKSFHDKGNVSGAVTVATVFGMAKRFGWKKSLDRLTQ
jgi:hypothetical protein